MLIDKEAKTNVVHNLLLKQGTGEIGVVVNSMHARNCGACKHAQVWRALVPVLPISPPYALNVACRIGCQLLVRRTSIKGDIVLLNCICFLMLFLLTND